MQRSAGGSVLKTVLYCIWQCTWGIIQSALGALMCLLFRHGNHYMFHGAVVTEWKYSCGISLGMFIFIEGNHGGISDKSVLVHEYGHTIQSLLLGPLYLLAIGIPSITWASLPFLRRKRKREGISYYSFYTERWANRLAAITLGKNSQNSPENAAHS